MFFGFALVIFLLLECPACVTTAKQDPAASLFSGKAQGFLYEIGEIKTGSFETAEYLPNKIRFELTKQLRERGLLAERTTMEKTLSVSLAIKAIYPGGSAGGEWNNEIISDVQVSDTHKNEIIARAEIAGLSAWGTMLSDFVEMTHAKEIADFLESIAR